MKVIFNTEFAPPVGNIDRIQNHTQDGFIISLRFVTNKYIPTNILTLLKNETNLKDVIRYQLSSFVKEARQDVEENIESIEVINNYFNREHFSGIKVVSGFNEHKENFVVARWEITVPDTTVTSLLESLKDIEIS